VGNTGYQQSVNSLNAGIVPSSSEICELVLLSVYYN